MRLKEYDVPERYYGRVIYLMEDGMRLRYERGY
jgi:hypothetical protein